MGWGYAFDPNKLQLSNNIKYRRKTQLKKKKKKYNVNYQCKVKAYALSPAITLVYFSLSFFFLFLAIPHCSRESQTRDWTHALSSESAESEPLEPQGVPPPP